MLPRWSNADWNESAAARHAVTDWALHARLLRDITASVKMRAILAHALGRLAAVRAANPNRRRGNWLVGTVRFELTTF